MTKNVVVKLRKESLQKTNKKQLSQNNKILRSQNFKYYLATLVSLITFLVYLKSLHNEFVNWDDDVYIYENHHIHAINTYLFKWSFLSFYAANWHPLTWLSHALDYSVWGLNPLGHHLTNNILHAANTSVVVLLMCRLLEIYKQRTITNGATTFLDDKSILIAGGISGLLFGLHPIHVESVAWVSERKDLLCALFFLLSIMMYAEYACFIPGGNVQNKTKSGFLSKHYGLSVGFFILALLSKPMAVSLPIVLLILDWYPFNRTQSLSSFRPAIIDKLPFFFLSLGSSVITLVAQKEGGSMNIELMAFVPLSGRVFVAAKSIIAYLWNMIAPINLIPYYPYPKYPSFFSLEYLSAIILVVGITTACVAAVKKQRLWLSVWIYFVTTLIPVIGLVQVGGQSMADRYTYLPSLGPFFAAGIGAAWISTRMYHIKVWGQRAKLATSIVIFFLFVSMIYLTMNQTRIWQSSFTLWNDVIEKRPGEIAVAYNNRGLIFVDQGQPEKALEDFNKAITLAPNFSEAYNNRGVWYLDQRQYDKAIKDINMAILLNPQSYQAYTSRGIFFGNIGKFDEAIKDLTTSISLNQNYVKGYLNRGLIFLQAGEIKIAVSDLRNACELGSDFGCKTLQYLGNKWQ